MRASTLISASTPTNTGPRSVQISGLHLSLPPGENICMREATPSIRQTLQQENQQRAVNQFVEAYQKKWKERTNCRDGFVVQSCDGAPERPATQQAAAPPAEGQAQAPPPEG